MLISFATSAMSAVGVRSATSGASDSSPHYVIADTSLDLRVPPSREDLRLGD
ncbi:hypothetical protein C884_00173 [Kocuria palustris PEL]|uniref:Uncharacterized protein n=1 Tax=Kocuria palustris PEL TaxID=1236550 RepID=M2XZ54_9MICC|nr:hypothetical protein C884_00173 [Kocuria palustris PEL]